MRRALGTFMRIIARRWPVLMAWALGTEAVHYAMIHLAGWAGSYAALAGVLVLPLAVLARLVGYVAMFLVVRDDLRSVPKTAAEHSGVRGFMNAVSGAMLPFLIFYAAWGLLDADRFEYFGIAADLSAKRHMGDPDFLVGTATDATFTTGSIVALGVALVLRLVLAALAHRTPRWMDIPAVYVEVVWITLLVTFVQGGVNRSFEWISTRVGAVWLTDLITSAFAGVPGLGAWLDSVGGLWGLLSTVVLLPAAWLAIVGTIYGDADDAPADAGSAPRRKNVAVTLISNRLEDIVAVSAWLGARVLSQLACTSSPTRSGRASQPSPTSSFPAGPDPNRRPTGWPSGGSSRHSWGASSSRYRSLWLRRPTTRSAAKRQRMTTLSPGNGNHTGSTPRVVLEISM